MILDVAGAELLSGHVVTLPLPGSGEEVRGYVVGCEDQTGDVFVMLTGRRLGTRLRIHGASCTLQLGAGGLPLVSIQRAGTESGLAEVEAA